MNKYSKLYIFLVILTVFVLTPFFSKANIQYDDKQYYCNVVFLSSRIGISSQELNKLCENLDLGPLTFERPPGFSIISTPVVGVFEIMRNLIPPQRVIDENKPIEKIPPHDFSIAQIGGLEIEYQNGLLSGLTILAMATTSLSFLGVGLYFTFKLLSFFGIHNHIIFLSILSLFTGTIFLHNIFHTILFPTCISFGFSAIFIYYFLTTKRLNPFLFGIFLSIMALLRYEFILFGLPVLLYFLSKKEYFELVKIILTTLLVFFGVYFVYNMIMGRELLSIQIQSGNIYLINLKYIYDSLISIKSGLVFYSTFSSIGFIVFVLKTGEFREKLLKIAVFFMMALYLIRIPDFYPIRSNEMYELIRYDINRYFVVFYPVCVIGISLLIEKIMMYWKERFMKNKT